MYEENIRINYGIIVASNEVSMMQFRKKLMEIIEEIPEIDIIYQRPSQLQMKIVLREEDV